MHLEWSKGGTASFRAVADDNVTLTSTIPSPPGARLEAKLLAEPSIAVRVKIYASKLETDGSFTLKGRLLEANRLLRERVALLVVESSGS